MNDNRLVKNGLFIALFIWLIWTIYWTIRLAVSLPDMFATPDPLGPLYFSSTLAVPSLFIGLAARTAAAALAIYTAKSYYSKGWTANVQKILGAVLVLEAVYLISILPTAWIGPDVNDIVLIPEATIPSLFEGIILPIPLVLLAARLRWPGKAGTTAKWAIVSGVTYLLALFVRFEGQWIATIVQTEKYTFFFGGFPYHGLSYILQYPANLLSFVLTTLGLPLLVLYVLASSLPTIQNFNIRKIGLALTLTGLYFMLSFFLLYALPESLAGGKSIWSQFFSGHNVDLWMLALPIVGIPMMFSSRGTKKEQNTETKPSEQQEN